MMQGYSSLQQKMNVFQRVIYKAQMLKEKPRMEMVYESGWLKLFDQYDTQDLPDTLWASILCAVCFSGLFAMERQTGMIKVIGTTPLGRRATVRYKLLLSFTVCGLITALSLCRAFGSLSVTTDLAHGWLRFTASANITTRRKYLCF